MGWDLASNRDIMRRLLAQGGAIKGPPQDATPDQNYAPGAPVRPVSQVTGSFSPTPKQPDTPLPVWGGESGYGNVNPQQRAFIEAQTPGLETAQAMPAAAYNWSQSRPSVEHGLPTWGTNILNQSAYNTLPKQNLDRPEFAPGFGGFRRYDTQIMASTQEPELSRYWDVPDYARGYGWQASVDTSQPGWTNRNAARFTYRPDTNFSFGNFLAAAAPMFLGAAFPGFGLGALGNAGTAASNAMSVGSAAMRN